MFFQLSLKSVSGLCSWIEVSEFANKTTVGCIIWHNATCAKMEVCRADANESSRGTPPTCSAFLYLPPEVPIGKEVSSVRRIKVEKVEQRQHNPENWKKKHFKWSVVRKNAPTVAITNKMECCI